MTADAAGAVRITQRDIYNEVVDLRKEVTPLVKAVPDHEERIRSLEKWAYAIPPTFLLAVAAVISAFVK